VEPRREKDHIKEDEVGGHVGHKWEIRNAYKVLD
jgi:hypothetical protein